MQSCLIINPKKMSQKTAFHSNIRHFYSVDMFQHVGTLQHNFTNISYSLSGIIGSYISDVTSVATVGSVMHEIKFMNNREKKRIISGLK